MNVDSTTLTSAGPGDSASEADVERIDEAGRELESFGPLDRLGGLSAVGNRRQTALFYTVTEVAIAQPDPEEEAGLAAAGAPEKPEEPAIPSPVNCNGVREDTANIYRDTNVMVVLDTSGSMTEDANGAPAGVQSRMGITKAVLANLLHTYDTLGDVRVTVVVFNEGATLHFSWGDIAAAIASLDTRVLPDRTRCAAGVETARVAWAADGKLPGDTKDVIYFLADGNKPAIGGGAGNHPTTAQKTAWSDFLENPASGIDHIYTVGIGDNDDSANSDPPDMARPGGDDPLPIPQQRRDAAGFR